MERISRERVERVARIYASNKDASQALGITLGISDGSAANSA